MTTGHDEGSGGPVRTCPRCGARRIEGAVFCEACAHDFTGDDLAAGVTPPTPAAVPEAAVATDAPTPAGLLAATPQAAPVGEESPLDVGWTGPTVEGEAARPQSTGEDGRRRP